MKKTKHTKRTPVLGELVTKGDYITRDGSVITINEYIAKDMNGNDTRWPWWSEGGDSFTVYGLNSSMIEYDRQKHITEWEARPIDLIKKISKETHPEEYL